MYLLIHSRVLSKSYFFVLFTFHNVSINSQVVQSEIFCKYYLHSIMYLLIPQMEFLANKFGYEFTFHNVSINSLILQYLLCLLNYLHSIMYLLIQKQSRVYCTKQSNLHSIMYLLIRVLFESQPILP